MANGLVERFNGVLKNMLRRTAFNNPKSWDKHIAPLLFAYRETPQASTGFSPFELVFSHKVKGPLDILKDLWTGEANGEVRSTYEYVINMRERLRDAVDLANEHLLQAKSR
ncbi:reverse transcriptase [Elysia marginata]|uniref:Reverse transcriptase n=1 Tax=Elysia marginata TaxID=1093978 RepID=A0AAV4GQN9_9GAST|nr:reverse transcriptase [Elysia marginata]